VSSAHVISVELFVQFGPCARHSDAAMHVHAPEPGAPVQVWCDPQVAALATSRHPFVSAAHVSSVDVFAQTAPVVVHAGLLLHTHAALPGFPVQLWFVPQVTVLVTTRHPFWSVVHVATVEAFSQTVPVAVHAGLLLHTHCPAPAAPVHTWFGPHATGAPYELQPASPTAHVARPPG
jgi:hypothetical protein